MGTLSAGEGAVGDFQKTTAFRIRRAQASVAKEGMCGHVFARVRACVRACECTRKRVTHPQESKGVRVKCTRICSSPHSPRQSGKRDPSREFYRNIFP